MLLNCHTHYSFGYGTYTIRELLRDVYLNGYSSLAITDINNTSAAIETLRLTEGKAIKAVIGVDFRNGIEQQYVGIAQNNTGYTELNNHLSKHLHANKNFDSIAPNFNNVFIIYPFSKYKGWKLKEHEYIGVSINELNLLAISAYKQLTNKLVILHQLSFANKIHFNTHRLLRAVHTNSLLSKLSSTAFAKGNELIMPYAKLVNHFANYPHLVRNTQQLLEQCGITFKFKQPKNKLYYTDSLENDRALLLHECEKGISYRYKNTKDLTKVRSRLEKELQVIHKLNFTSYFLINWDIVQYARNNQLYHVGRGSGANSLIAYLIGITNVDPIELDLYFERFISEQRSNPPDFDIDFSWRDRENITSYIFNRFNTNNNVALTGSYSTFQKDAVIHELGKAFGFAPAEVNKLKTKILGYTNQNGYNKQKPQDILLYYANLIIGKPSHLSVHASGILIAQESITNYTATFLPPKGYQTTQFSMIEAEDLGLLKFDILSQRGLGKIKDAIDIISQNKKINIDINDVAKFKEDPLVKKLIKEAKTIGCFYVESPAMRMLLIKLKADDYVRLVAASSIIRPGVSQSGMMNEYVKRYRDVKLREIARKKLPELYNLLEETYGVMVYQEDVIKVAHLFADLTLDEADVLRRGMSWKFKERKEFTNVRDKFFKNCSKKGYNIQLVKALWNQMDSFANFAFAKGHSASYAIESFQTLYLKAYYPLEYLVATINNGGGFYSTELYIHEAKVCGGNIIPPCVNKSNLDTTIQNNNIYLGLNLIKGLSINSINLILNSRNLLGEFKSVEDFIERVEIPTEHIQLLIRMGSFEFTGKTKKQLLWELHFNLYDIKPNKMQLFENQIEPIHTPALNEHPIEDKFEEYELLGFPLCHPFELLKCEIPINTKASQFYQFLDKTIEIVGYLVNIKYTRTSKGKKMMFGTFLDQNGDWIDTVHFPDTINQCILTKNSSYLIIGKVSLEYDFITVNIISIERLPFIDREMLTLN